MGVVRMSLGFEAVPANVKVIADDTVVGEYLVESVTCVFTNNTLPNSILIFGAQCICSCVKQAMVMHQGVLRRRNEIFPCLQEQTQKDSIRNEHFFFEEKGGVRQFWEA